MTAPASPRAMSPEPRVRLEFGGTQRTLLDGGWWPRSADPAAELPNLVPAIDVVHGPITRLLLSISGWQPRPRRLTVNDRILRLAYFASQPAALLTALCHNGERVDLLVVPPDTDAAVAEAAMTIAATSTNRMHAEHIVPAVARRQRSEATRLSEQIWETEGGMQPLVTGGAD